MQLVELGCPNEQARSAFSAGFSRSAFHALGALLGTALLCGKGCRGGSRLGRGKLVAGHRLPLLRCRNRLVSIQSFPRRKRDTSTRSFPLSAICSTSPFSLSAMV